MDPLAALFAPTTDYGVAFPDLSTAMGIGETPVTKARSRQHDVQESGARVCDRCIVKKVKCDMKQPRCSRCLESESSCVYSVKKRKPGPVKGSKHAKRRISKNGSHESSVSEPSSLDSRRRPHAQGQQPNPWQFEQPAAITLSTLPTSIPSFFSTALSPSSLSQSAPSPLGIPPSQDQQTILLERFFLQVHPAMPLFRQQRLLAQYETGTICQNLLLTICVVTAKVLRMEGSWNGSSLEDCMAYLLDLKVLENEGAGKPLSLDNFRQACLLAYYAFHQYPGEKAWMRIGNLTRKAYQCGLHQIDHHSAGSQFDREKVGLEDLEEWRYVWWCIYCLDSYSNAAAVTPFVVEMESVKTVLVSSSLTEYSDGMPLVGPPKYLPDDTDTLWQTAKEIISSSHAVDFNMHILTTTLIREAATIHRLSRQSTSKRLRSRSRDLEDHFSAFRLALPPHYLNASRHAFVDESSSDHHSRLISVLHVHLARLLIYFPNDVQRDKKEWLDRWQQCLESIQDIVSAVKQWDSQYSTATDPAICFIVSTALILLHLYSCAEDITEEFRIRTNTQKDVLVLFLEQFASSWSLPRFLIISFEQLKKIITGPLGLLDIDRILMVAVGPLTYRWLNFLSLSTNFENLDSPGCMYENLFSQEWDSNEWEALMPIIQN